MFYAQKQNTHNATSGTKTHTKMHQDNQRTRTAKPALKAGTIPPLALLIPAHTGQDLLTLLFSFYFLLPL